MEKNVVHLGLDVDDSAFHGCAFLKKSGEIIVETCSVCSHKYRIIAAILERAAIVKILTHLRLPTNQPPMALARPPPLFAHARHSTPLPT